MSIEGAVAVQRFGLGARPGEIETASRDPKQWLKDQLAPADQPASDTKLMSAGELLAYDTQFHQKEKALRTARKDGQVDEEAQKALYKERAEMMQNEMAARFATGFTTERPFAERLVWFWSNHFAVSTAKGECAPFALAFEREVIRPNIAGSFEDMVQAAVRHPAMLLYLDNAQSIGPDSQAGLRTHKGLNENLGRELMELYTLGVDGGYTQADVIAMAKLLTGFSIDRENGGSNGFRFFQPRHEPGAITLRGNTYPPGEAGATAAISDLVRDPATARHIARKFAQAFIADTPHRETVARLEHAFLKTNGNLRALAEAAIDDPHAWSPTAVKMRSPVEYVTAAYRLLDLPKPGKQPNAVQNQVRSAMGGARLMGEFPLAALSPKGWPLDSTAWSGPDAVLNRIEWARQVAQRVPPNADVMHIADQGLGPLARRETLEEMGRASTKGEAVALLLVSPEFQRR